MPTYLPNYYLRREKVLHESKNLQSREDFEDEVLEKMQMALQTDWTSV